MHHFNIYEKLLNVSNVYRTIVIADPSLLEERRSEASVVFGINAYRELCGLHFGGITLASLELLIKCANDGAKRAKTVVKQIKAALEADEKRRTNGEAVGFSQCLQSERFDLYKEGPLALRLPRFQLNATEDMEIELEQMKQEQARIKSLGENSAVLLPAEELSEEDENWIPDLDDDDGEGGFYFNPAVSDAPATKSEKKPERKRKKPKQSKAMSDDSEEEETVVMEQIT